MNLERWVKWQKRGSDEVKNMKFFIGNLGKCTGRQQLGAVGMYFALNTHYCFQQYSSKINWEPLAVISRLALI